MYSRSCCQTARRPIYRQTAVKLMCVYPYACISVIACMLVYMCVLQSPPRDFFFKCTSVPFPTAAIVAAVASDGQFVLPVWLYVYVYDDDMPPTHSQTYTRTPPKCITLPIRVLLLGNMRTAGVLCQFSESMVLYMYISLYVLGFWLFRVVIMLTGTRI